MKLLIVESPGKTKKLKEYLGEGWEVKASIGHICDLPKKELGIDKLNSFKLAYQVSEDKKDVVKGLASAIQSAGKDNVYLATDPDREGEAISFHLCRNLNLDYKTAKRVTFQEITKTAVQNAVKSPRLIDIPLVSAQEARRAIDRLVGFEISPILWRKIKSDTPLSAGRVQSVALKLIVERERQILDFGSLAKFKISGQFLTPEDNKLKASAKFDFEDLEQAKAYLKSTQGKEFAITSISKTPNKTQPKAPFSTSTLQQDANKRLKFSVEKTMQVAQKLYEGGHITYMRTDSVNLSETAVELLSTFIVENYGQNYLEKRTFKNKNESAQEAHEAIRPSNFTAKEIEGSEDEKALYNLIYLRAVASQMRAKETDVTTLTINSKERTDEFTAKASIVTFDGFTKAYSEDVEEDNEESEEVEIKETLNEGDSLKVSSIIAKQTYSKPKSRFDEAELVKELESLGIGRPSTYASILRNIKDVRQYIFTGKIEGSKLDVLTITFENDNFSESKSSTTLGGAKDKLLPNPIAFTLIDFLQVGFSNIMDYKFTANIEEDFDKIASSKLKYLEVVQGFDLELSRSLKQVDSNHQDIEGKEKKTVDVGVLDKETIKAGKGEKGVYIIYKEKFYNIPDVAEKEQVTFEMATKAIQEKKEAEKVKKEEKQANTLYTFGKYNIFKNDKGVYIEKGEDICPVPKWDLEKLDTYNEEKCKEAMTKFKAWKKAQNKK